MGNLLTDDTRTVLRLTGADVRPFLQGIVTNDVGRLGPDRALYAALLTPQGKYLFDFILVDAGDAVLLDVASDGADQLAARLGMYRLRRDVTIAPAGLSVVLAWPGGDWPAADGALAVADPRHPDLGLRIYAADAAAVHAALGGDPAPAAAYEALRIGLGVPARGSELIPGESYILEAGFERFRGVDFRKGCYVGQEVTARMKHRAELRRGLARVAIHGDTPAAGSPVMAGDRAAGRICSALGGRGIAQLRFDRADGPLTAGAARIEVLERL